ncbi:DUF6065 family protein [Kaistia nematophila]|uniref:DUF6065 family protein n=1 Tax=Kaistia nematophila TaxID=2994654 RepID=A0A9X3E404_9HYPH|nr:DUF6065 family protein [Kaistia nematophila]MCX5570728.1 DUF6065 family protein [Kaistia nematophila]
MELTCYLYPGWKPRIRAASSRRGWMDATPEAFAYRCLPLAIANSHGWEILSPCSFEAVWNGGMAPGDVIVRAHPGSLPHERPVGLFGQGVLTFHIAGILRTSPGWNLWVGGPVNSAKDGISPLSGVVETDWSSFTFTMNWRFTRPHHPVRFEENEPFCHIFPVERAAIEMTEPRFASIEDEAGLKEQFESWSRSRDAFHRKMAQEPPAAPADKWQKFYYRGIHADGAAGIADHQTKLRAREFKSESGKSCPMSSRNGGR